jgi:hypothetical protein
MQESITLSRPYVTFSQGYFSVCTQEDSCLVQLFYVIKEVCEFNV